MSQHVEEGQDQEFDPNLTEESEQQLENQNAQEPEAEALEPVGAAVAQTNGHASAHPVGTMVQVREEIIHPQRPYAPPPAPAPVRRASPRQAQADKNVMARKMLDDIAYTAEATDWELRVHRLPKGDKLANGDYVRCGFLQAFDVMPYDNMRDAIGRLWGGGEYRIVACDKNSHAPILDNAVARRAAFISINTQDYPVKNGPDQVDEVEPMVVTEDDEEAESDRNTKRAMKRMREEQAKQRLLSVELETKRRQAEIRKLEREIREDETPEKKDSGLELKLIDMRNAQDKALEELRRQQEKDRDSAERRAKEDRDFMMNSLKDITTSLGNQISKIADIATRPAPVPDRMPEMMASMQNSTNAMLAALVPALMPKKDDTTQMQIEQQSKMFEMMIRLSARENSQSADLTKQLIAVALQPKKESSTKELLELMEYGRKLTDHSFRLARGEDEAENAGPWNPKIGVLGNLGNAFMGIFKEAISKVASSPQAMELVTRFFNKTNPSEEEQIQVAQQLEREQAARALGLHQNPALAAPQVGVQVGVQPHQPLVTPPPQMRPQQMVQQPQRYETVPGVFVRNRQPQVRPPQQQQRPGQPPVQAQPGGIIPVAKTLPPSAKLPPQDPATLKVANATPEVAKQDPEEAAAKANAAIQAEIESEVTGVGGGEEIDISQVGQEAPPAVVPAAAPGVMDVVNIQNAGQGMPPAPPQQQPPAQIPDHELRLRERISAAMEEATENITDAIAVHDWPQIALDTWNAGFLNYFAHAPSDEVRFVLIEQRCDPEVMKALKAAMANASSEPPQYIKFYDGIREITAQVLATQQPLKPA